MAAEHRAATATPSPALPALPLLRVREGCHDATGGVVGGQLGYRWQWGPSWVFGVEVQGDWADLKGNEFQPDGVVPYTNQTKIDAIGLFTGQVGYAWNNVLWYVKGGAAITDNKYNSYFTATSASVQPNQRHPLGWHGGHRRRNQLCAELVGCLRIRPSVHGDPQHRLPAHGHRCRPHRQRASGRRHRERCA